MSVTWKRMESAWFRIFGSHLRRGRNGTTSPRKKDEKKKQLSAFNANNMNLHEVWIRVIVSIYRVTQVIWIDRATWVTEVPGITEVYSV